MPDTTWPISAPARLIPGWVGRPVSMSSNADFDTSSVDRSRSSSWPTPDALTGAPCSPTLTTTALDRSNSGWFAASPCRATAEAHQPIGLAPPSPMQHRINRPDLPHRPPHAFVAHPTRLRSPNKAPVPDRPTLRPEPDRASTTQFHATRRSTNGTVLLARIAEEGSGSAGRPALVATRRGRPASRIGAARGRDARVSRAIAFALSTSWSAPLHWRHLDAATSVPSRRPMPG